MSDAALFVCTRCPADSAPSFDHAGRLAGHLVEDHNVSPSVAIAEARKPRASSSSSSAPTPTPHAPPAPAAPIEPTTTTEDQPMKKKRKPQRCSKCGGQGHNALSCLPGQRSGDAAKPTVEKTSSRRRPSPEPSPAETAVAGLQRPGSAAPVDALELRRQARDQAQVLVRLKVREEIIYAEEYLAALRKIEAAG